MNYNPRCASLSIMRCWSRLRISTKHFGEGHNERAVKKMA
jgi:hypothetical protein